MKIKTADALDCTLDEDVLSAQGNLILPAGVPLSQPLINALLKQHIETIEVVGMSTAVQGVPDEGPSEQAAHITLAEKDFAEHVEKLFLKHQSAHMKEFKQCLLKKNNVN